jgi:hypothetical protein
MIEPTELTKALQAAGIQTAGCNSNGIVWDIDGITEIQTRPDVAAIIVQHLLIDWDARQTRVQDRQNSASNEAKLATQLKTITPQEAVDYVVQQITNGVSEATALQAFDNATTFAAVKPILRNMLISIYRIVDILKLVARILIAVRNQLWPQMPEE